MLPLHVFELYVFWIVCELLFLLIVSDVSLKQVKDMSKHLLKPIQIIRNQTIDNFSWQFDLFCQFFHSGVCLRLVVAIFRDDLLREFLRLVV